MNIRKGQPEDIPEIANILVKGWQIGYTNFVPHSFLIQMDTQKQMARHQNYFDKGTSYFVAIDQTEKVIGFISYGESRLSPFREMKEIYSLYVHPNSQKQGVGQQLLDELKRLYKQKKDNIIVSVFRDNPFNKFYIKNGFTLIGNDMIDMKGFELPVDIYALKTESYER